MTKRNKNIFLILVTIFACIVMGIVDAIIQPGYIIKSLIKIFMFLLLPILYSFFDKETDLKSLFNPQKKGLVISFIFGISVYFIIICAYFVFKNVFDFSSLTSSLTSTTGVNKDNFIFVAIYISFANSLLEEFFFRGFSFLTLKKNTNQKFAYIFSSLLFALYHIAMMIGWFNIFVIILAIIGLFIGGFLFNFFNEKYNNIYISWIIHMFANFAINTIGIILFNS